MSFIKQTRRTLDSKFEAVKIPSRPRAGWIKEIRKALGMSEVQLAKKLNITPPTMARLQKSEEEMRITVRRLQDVAEALDCEFMYVLRPKKHLQQMVRDRAYTTAVRILNAVDHTMSLEDQRTSKTVVDEQINDLVEEMIVKADKRIWDEE